MRTLTLAKDLKLPDDEAVAPPEGGVMPTYLPRSGTFDTYLSRLRTLELVEGRGDLKASDELFD